MPRPPRLSPCCAQELRHPCRSEPRVQGPEVSIKGKRNEASRVWRHSHVTPLHGVKLAQVTTLCQNGSRLCWLCHSQVKAGICSQEDGGSHPFFAVAVVGSSMAHWGPGSSVRVLSAALCLAGPQRPSTSQWSMALVRSSHHGHWDITDVLPTLVGTDPQLKVFLRPVPCLGVRALSPLRLEGSFSSPRGILVALELCGASKVWYRYARFDQRSCKGPAWVRSCILHSSPSVVQLRASA